MEAHPNAPHMLRQACQMVRNLNVRNPENRYELLEQAHVTLRLCPESYSSTRYLGLRFFLVLEVLRPWRSRLKFRGVILCVAFMWLVTLKVLDKDALCN